jgi:phosphonate transport system substrate-binding protein
MNSLTISSCMAPNMEFVCVEVGRYLSERLSIPVESVLDIPWQERERRLDAGQIDLCWICGLPYVWKADRKPSQVEVLVAPVMSGSRYGGLPVYYSDVIVHRDSPYRKLDDLRGASWAYNEPRSHSGYGLVRYSLISRGYDRSFLGNVIESGAHQNSLQMILKKEVDWSAIDSTVLEMELAINPSISNKFRIVDTFGPSPIPPWVVSRNVPADLKEKISQLFLTMGEHPQGEQILARARIQRFVTVVDRDYDPIRTMGEIADVFK